MTEERKKLGMLMLGRKLDEQIVIGDNITIKVCQIRGDQVRLGIIAPKEVSILRKELVDGTRRRVPRD
jgi:carbon storage regulator